MWKFFQIVAIALLAGCATSSHREKIKLPPNWESELSTNQFAPVIPAPPPTPSRAQFLRPTNRISGTWVPLDRWSKFYNLPEFQRVSLQPTPTYALSVPEGVMFIRVNSQSARWNGLEFELGFAPQWVNGQPLIHALDGEKNFLPLLRGTAESPKPRRVIVIDPGHGGVDSGAKNVWNGRPEKEFNLDCALRLQQLLATNGWQVVLTRSNDFEVSLMQRVALAGRAGADLFVSLHFNSGAPGDHAGLETYCLTPQGLPSTLTRGYPDDASLSFPNNTFDLENFQLAEQLHRALLQLGGKIDRGVRRARFMTVLRWQHCPAVLIEGGYLSNRDEARLIANPEYRQKFAEALAKAFVEKPEASTHTDDDQ